MERETGSRLDRRIAQGLGIWVDAVWQRSGFVLAALAMLATASGLYAATTLRVQSDNVKLVSEGLAFRRAFEELVEELPVVNRSLVVLVEADQRAASRAAADALALALREAPAIGEVFQPGGGPFFRRQGLLYRDVEALDDLVDRLARLQPVLSQLEHAPEVGALARWARDLLERGGVEPEAPTLWVDLFARLRQAADAAVAGRSAPGDWSEIAEAAGEEAPARAVLFVEPRDDYAQLAEAAEAIESVRGVANALWPPSEPGSPRVRVTGYPALAYEEAQGLRRDSIAAGLASLCLAAFILRLALCSWRLVAAGTLTLLAGLALTAGFAAMAIGSLNIISMLFAVLFVGLGVDFAIHLGLRYLDELALDRAPRDAMRCAAERAGPALTLCATSTSIGFFSFVPTEYRGVAELGLIAGTGMFVIFALSFSLLPALLALGLRPRRPVAPHRSSRAPREAFGSARFANAIFVGAAAVVVLALVALPRLRFDPNVIEMRDPATESVQAFRTLLAESGLGSPWSIDILADDAPQAAALAERLEPLAVVDRALDLAAWVPEDQAEKLELLDEAAFLLDSPAPAIGGPAQGRAELAALRSLLGKRAAQYGDRALRESAIALLPALDRLLARAEGAEQAVLMAALRDNVIGNLPERLADLREALRATAFGVEDLPPALLRRIRTNEGRVRVQVLPAEDLNDPDAWARFADGVREIEPRATGLPINLLEFGRVTTASLRQAFATALVAIAGLLIVLGHRRELAYVLLPLLWAGIATAGATIPLGIELNFANVIVLPLLLGIGVDSAIHLVLRWREGGDTESLLGTSTARAVGYSALTTAVSFGTLAFAAHRGVASLGLLLVVGLIFTLLASLLLLPAVLARSQGAKS